MNWFDSDELADQLKKAVKENGESQLKSVTDMMVVLGFAIGRIQLLSKIIISLLFFQIILIIAAFL